MAETHWIVRKSSDGDTWATADDYLMMPGKRITNTANAVAIDPNGTVWVAGQAMDANKVNHAITRSNISGHWATVDDYQLVGGFQSLARAVICDPLGRPYVAVRAGFDHDRTLGGATASGAQHLFRRRNAAAKQRRSNLARARTNSWAITNRPAPRSTVRHTSSTAPSPRPARQTVTAFDNWILWHVLRREAETQINGSKSPATKSATSTAGIGKAIVYEPAPAAAKLHGRLRQRARERRHDNRGHYGGRSGREEEVEGIVGVRGDDMSDLTQQALVARETIDRAARMLLDAAPKGSEVIVFGSYARGDASAESDVDFMVVEPSVQSQRAEMVRLREVLRPLRIPVDVLVVSREGFEAWKDKINNVVYEAAREGRVYAA